MALPPGPVGLKFWQPRNETTAGPQAWYTLYNLTLTGDQNSQGDRTIRLSAGTAAYDAGAPATASKLRLTIQSSSTVGLAWDKIYIGHVAPSGDTVDFDGSQVQVLWSGSASGSIAAASSLLSDEITYAFDKNRALVVTIHTTGVAASAGVRNLVSPTGFETWSVGGADEAAVTDVNLASYSFSSQLRAFSKIEVYGAAADAGNVTLPADGGSYTLTGADAGLGVGYWLTGSDVSFVTASSGTTTLTADAGSYVLTGSAAALAYSATLTAGAGSYALTGSAIGLGLGYWLTGSDVTFTTATAGGTTLTADAGSYTLTGSAAALALRHTAGAGSYGLTGTAAIYRVTTAAAAGSYALTGSPVGFLAPFNLPAAPGAYTLTGFDAALTVISGIVLFCGSGSYTLTGFNAELPQPGGPVEPPTTPPGGTYVGGPGGASRGRMIRRRKRKEEEELEIAAPVDLAPPAPGPTPPDLKPPPPGLMADVRMPQRKPLPPHVDEDEDEIALLLELLS